MKMFPLTGGITVCLMIVLAGWGYAQQVPAKQDSSKTSASQEGAQSDSLTTSQEEEKPDSLSYSRPEYMYESMGKRDPFSSLVPKEEIKERKIKGLFSYEGSVIMGIVNSSEDSYALVLDANGSSYVLREGSSVLGGTVTRITDDGVYLHIVKYGRSMTIILRLQDSKYTVYEEGEEQATIRKPGINVTYEQGEATLESKEITIEDVTVPSIETKTVEEEWFGESPEGKDVEHGEKTKEDTETCLLIEPAKDSWVRLPAIFDWIRVPKKDVTYSLVIDDNPDFESPLYSKEGIRTSSLLLNSDIILPPNRTLYWKVSAIDSSGKIYPSQQKDMSFKIVGEQ